MTSPLARLLPPSAPSPAEDARRQHELEAKAYHRHRMVVVRLDEDRIPGLVRMWLESEARRKFE